MRGFTGVTLRPRHRSTISSSEASSPWPESYQNEVKRGLSPFDFADLESTTFGPTQKVIDKPHLCASSVTGYRGGTRGGGKPRVGHGED